MYLKVGAGGELHGYLDHRKTHKRSYSKFLQQIQPEASLKAKLTKLTLSYLRDIMGRQGFLGWWHAGGESNAGNMEGAGKEEDQI